MGSITVKDANGVIQTIQTANTNGQATSANSSPVVIANDQSPIPVTTGLSQGLTDAQLRASALITNPTLPTGASTDGTDGTGIVAPTGGVGIRGWLSGIYSRLSKGSSTASNSLSVVLASDQSALPLSTDAAVSSKQPALGTAGSPSVDVLSIQGVANGTAIPSYTTMGSPVNRSGTITTGGSSQQLAAANSARRGLIVYNLSSNDIWINIFGVSAVLSQPSLLIPAGVYQEFPVGSIGISTINIIGATTSQAFYAQEY